MIKLLECIFKIFLLRCCGGGAVRVFALHVKNEMFQSPSQWTLVVKIGSDISTAKSSTQLLMSMAHVVRRRSYVTC